MIKICLLVCLSAFCLKSGFAHAGEEDKEAVQGDFVEQYFIIKVKLDGSLPPRQVSENLSQKIKKGSVIYWDVVHLIIIMKGKRATELFLNGQEPFAHMKTIPGVKSIVSSDTCFSRIFVE